MVHNNTCKYMPTLYKKCIWTRVCAPIQLCFFAMEAIANLSWARLARTSCRLSFTARPSARSLAGNPLGDVVRSRNPSKSTLAHEAVATAVLHKHHPIIRVGAGLIQFVYRSYLCLATEATRNRNAFPPFFARVFKFKQFFCWFEITVHT